MEKITIKYTASIFGKNKSRKNEFAIIFSVEKQNGVLDKKHGTIFAVAQKIVYFRKSINSKITLVLS